MSNDRSTIGRSQRSGVSAWVIGRLSRSAMILMPPALALIR